LAAAVRFTHEPFQLTLELTLNFSIPRQDRYMSNARQDLFVRELLDVFTETFEKVQGIYLDRSTSLFETLETISAEEASRPVSATCATIAAQVEHVRYYIDVLGTYMIGQKPENVNWKHIWETISSVSPEEWDASRARLKASYDETITRIKGFQSWDEGDHLPAALAIVVHTAYHLGEIRQALCVVKAG
jgi:hypothetical protein